jgi:vacuolar-type H+-ATPase subunit F/Vma7
MQMKENLTDKQKETLTYLEGQFIALNENNKSVPFNLVDVNKITAEANRLAVGKQNLKIHNEGIVALRNQLAEKFAKQINEDFERGNLPLMVKIGTFHDLDITGYNMKYRCDRSFNLEIRPKEKQTEFGTEYTGEFYFTENYLSKEKFDTVEAYFASNTIQKNLLRLFQYVENDNECQR